MPRITHVHRWQLSIHVDQCHAYTSTYACVNKCGHSLGSYDERDPEADPYSLIWMEPMYDEHGEEIECERCTELQTGKGEPPIHKLSVAR